MQLYKLNCQPSNFSICPMIVLTIAILYVWYCAVMSEPDLVWPSAIAIVIVKEALSVGVGHSCNNETLYHRYDRKS